HIGGNVTTWGTKTGSGTVGPPGAVSANVCTSAPATQPMPVFSYSASNYDPNTLHEFGTPTTPSSTAVQDFQTYVAAHPSTLQGTFFVNQAGAVNQGERVELSGVTIIGD